MKDSKVDDQTRHIGEAGLRRLRHDLLNGLNVFVGTTTILLDTELTDVQKSCVRLCRSTADRLLKLANNLEEYQTDDHVDGPKQLADLCSIAAARIDKPFDRDTLRDTIRRLAPVPNPRVLLVDDAPDIATLVHTFLRDTGCTIDVLADGERAVAQATSQPYDVVLMDVDLPGIDGATAAHAIRAADLARGAKPTPVVALSAFGAELRPSTDKLEKLMTDDPEIASLVPSFLDSRAADVAKMRSLLASGNYARIQALGHRMKGSGRSYGFQDISRIGAELEIAAHNDNEQMVRQLIDELENYLTKVQVQG